MKELKKYPTCEECLEIDRKIEIESQGKIMEKGLVHLAWICERKRHNQICLKDLWSMHALEWLQERVNTIREEAKNHVEKELYVANEYHKLIKLFLEALE